MCTIVVHPTEKKIGRIPELVTAEQFCMEIVTLPSAFFLPIGLKMANDWQKWTRGRTLDGGRLTLIMTQISVFTAVSLRFITLFFPLTNFVNDHGVLPAHSVDWP